MGEPARISTSAASPARSRAARSCRATTLRVLPSGRESRVARIVTIDGDLEQAVAGQSVTLTLADEIDVSRGDVLAAGRRAARRSPTSSTATIIWMADEPLLPGRPYLLKIGTQVVTATITAPKYKVNVNTLEHLAAKTLELNEIGVCNLVARPADRVRPLRREPRHRRLHPDRPPDQRHRRRRACCTSRCAARRTSTGRRSTSNKAARAGAQGPEAVRAVVHRPVRRRQVDDRQPGREAAARARPPHLPARRRQRAPRPEPDLGFTDADRVENIRRVAEVAQADGRRRADRAGVVHLAVPRRAAHGARAVRAGRVHRGLRRHAARGRRGARPEGPLPEGAPRASSRTSPASTRPTSRRSIRRSTSTPRTRRPRSRRPSSSRSCARRACSGPAG